MVLSCIKPFVVQPTETNRHTRCFIIWPQHTFAQSHLQPLGDLQALMNWGNETGYLQALPFFALSISSQSPISTGSQDAFADSINITPSLPPSFYVSRTPDISRLLPLLICMHDTSSTRTGTLKAGTELPLFFVSPAPGSVSVHLRVWP